MEFGRACAEMSQVLDATWNLIDLIETARQERKDQLCLELCDSLVKQNKLRESIIDEVNR